MSGLSAAAACTRGCASTSVGKRCSSEICRMAVGCSDGAAEVSSGTVWHDRRVVSAPPVELLLAKIGLSAAIVIGVSLAAERLGPRLGGLIAATPQLSVLALVFFTLEQGREFAAETAFWTIPGMCATIPVYFVYLAAADRVDGSRLGSIAV